MEGFENKGNALGRFIEECGEALAAAGKTVRFGWRSYNPLPGASKEINEDWLQREIQDLEVAIARLRKSRDWECDAAKVPESATPTPARPMPQEEVQKCWRLIDLGRQIRCTYPLGHEGDCGVRSAATPPAESDLERVIKAAKQLAHAASFGAISLEQVSSALIHDLFTAVRDLERVDSQATGEHR